MSGIREHEWLPVAERAGVCGVTWPDGDVIGGVVANRGLRHKRLSCSVDSPIVRRKIVQLEVVVKSPEIVPATETDFIHAYSILAAAPA